MKIRLLSFISSALGPLWVLWVSLSIGMKATSTVNLNQLNNISAVVGGIEPNVRKCKKVQ